MREKILAFIPKHISNRTVLGFFEFLRIIAHISKAKVRDHLKKNEAFFERNSISGFIENQNDYGDVVYGKKNLAFSGCEIIAVYNALLSLGLASGYTLSGLISDFEKDGMVLGGRFGTSPKAIKDFFIRGGFKCDFASNEAEFGKMESLYDTLILTLYNDRFNIKHQIHTINVSKTPEGLIGHNIYGDGRYIGPCANLDSLIGLINRGKAKGICLIGINKRA